MSNEKADERFLITWEGAREAVAAAVAEAVQKLGELPPAQVICACEDATAVLDRLARSGRLFQEKPETDETTRTLLKAVEDLLSAVVSLAAPPPPDDLGS